jgi:hypothetical protein
MGQALHTADRCGLCHRRHAPAKGRTIGFDDLLAHGRIGELDPDRFYEEWGLPAPLSEMRDPALQARMHRMSLEDLAIYADTITVHNAHFEAFGLEDLASLEKSPAIDQVLNAAAMGNIAHLALHAAPPDVRERFRAQAVRMQAQIIA